ncbi:ABC transporter ATP-binding protein [Azospirillum sp. HJ39]|uniref:ABC transporter ATP-binding protein n=1 Tax=Azospirillum sp. HJ39 TaxID=3159496 RepID=UPI0035567D4C
MMQNEGVLLSHVGKSYAVGQSRLNIFEDLSLHIPPGDFLALMGPSGSGKSTILNLIGGIDGVDSGEVTVGGQRIDRMGQGALTRWRAANVGFVFQSYHLLPMLTAEQNVALPLLLTGLSGRERRRRARTVLEIVGLSERAGHLPSELSGGQQQRVGVARAIATDPKILLCDEPTGNLDRQSANEILQILGLLNAELAKTIVMVTHDEAAARAARRTLVLDKGAFAARELAACS